MDEKRTGKKSENTEIKLELNPEMNSDTKLSVKAKSKVKADVKPKIERKTKVKATKAESSSEAALEATDMQLAVADGADAKPVKVKRKRRHISEITAENDIKFRGPLSYRHLRIIAWVCLAIAQIAFMMKIYVKMDASVTGLVDAISPIMSFFGELATPLFLFANFAIILSGKQSYKSLLIRYGALAGVFLFAFIIVYAHYVLGILTAFTGSRADAREMFLTLMQIGEGYLAFNIFLDLLLCTLFLFFLNYKPKKVFVGKKLIIFRLFALLPIVYEAISVLLKILASTGAMALSPWFYPFLTTKPPLEFLMFIVIGLHLKHRERKYMKRGKTLEEHKAFIDTNSNSLHFSIFSSVAIVVTVIMDFLIFVVLAAMLIEIVPGIEDPEIYANAFTSAIQTVMKWGFGQSISLLLLIPVIMFFSYTRQHKNPKIDLFVPIGGVSLIILLYLEGVYLLLCLLPTVMGG